MSTAEELLCSRKWRLRHGLWMLWGWFPFALTAWVGYLVIGVKSRNWKWITIAIAFFLYGIAWFVSVSLVGNATAGIAKGDAFPEPYQTINMINFSASFLIWIGNAAGLQWWINRKWLVWRAHNHRGVSVPWYATATAGTTPHSIPDQRRVSAAIDGAVAEAPPRPEVPPPSSSAQPPAPAPLQSRAPASPAGSLGHPLDRVLDVNGASEGEIASLPGLDADIAAQIVATRTQGGGFHDLAELVTRAGVKPHVLAGVQSRLAVLTEPGPAPSTPAPLPPTSENGRRLEF